MRTKLTLVAASLATLMMTTAHAAPPPAEADLSITAKVIPSACTLDFANHGITDYGDILASSLNSSGTTDLLAKSQNYNIVCPIPTRVLLSLVDNRAGTTGVGSESITDFGLNTDSRGTKIGEFFLKYISTVVVNSNPGQMLRNIVGDSTWHVINVGNTIADKTNSSYSFASASGAPEAITTVAGVWDVMPKIVEKSLLDLTRVVELDGSITAELTYI